MITSALKSERFALRFKRTAHGTFSCFFTAKTRDVIWTDVAFPRSLLVFNIFKTPHIYSFITYFYHNDSLHIYFIPENILILCIASFSFASSLLLQYDSHWQLSLSLTYLLTHSFFWMKVYF